MPEGYPDGCRASCHSINVCLQFAYAFLLGSFPFNSFLAGMASCIGFFVLTGRCCTLPQMCGMAPGTLTCASLPLQYVCECKSTPAIMTLKADLQSGPLLTMFCAIACFTSSSGTTWADTHCELLSDFMTISCAMLQHECNIETGLQAAWSSEDMLLWNRSCWLPWELAACRVVKGRSLYVAGRFGEPAVLQSQATYVSRLAPDFVKDRSCS